MSVRPYSLFSQFDIELFKSGKHYRLYEKFGAFPAEFDEKKGVYFSVFAPAASKVYVTGDFNYWSKDTHPLLVRWDGSGIWEGFIEGVEGGIRYKYIIQTANNQWLEKADPFARFSEIPPKNASIVWQKKYHWKDDDWMSLQAQKNGLQSPMSVYEVHLLSWRWKVEENRPLSFLELAEVLPAYIAEMGFTHVEFMPVMDYPYEPSWGYQITGYFAVSPRQGNPEEFKSLIDALHIAGIGVILDWVPAHFPSDAHGLGNFDGSCVYEHPDPRRGYHPDWKSLIFNYGRPEVRSFLISNALYWLDRFHIDGLRVDAVASMLYLDYSRNSGEWEPNQFGGRENLEAIEFLKELNSAVYKYFPAVQTIAEESTAFPSVTKPVHWGGLGFGMKWMMGWMHDSLKYIQRDPIHRKYHQNELTQSLGYVFSENFTLPISHDEVVYGKKSLLSKMPGNDWQKFANLRLYLGFMFTHPGSKLLFMGSEFAQLNEWDFSKSLDWHLLEHTSHRESGLLVQKLNLLYKQNSALHTQQYDSHGFEWIDFNDQQNSVISFIRKSVDPRQHLVVVCNFTPSTHESYRIGCPSGRQLNLLFNSDSTDFGGSGFGVFTCLNAEENMWHGRSHSVLLRVPPLSVMIYESI